MACIFRYGDPLTTFVSDRVNEGAPGTPTYPRLYEGVYPRRESGLPLQYVRDGIVEHCVTDLLRGMRCRDFQNELADLNEQGTSFGPFFAVFC